MSANKTLTWRATRAPCGYKMDAGNHDNHPRRKPLVYRRKKKEKPPNTLPLASRQAPIVLRHLKVYRNQANTHGENKEAPLCSGWPSRDVSQGSGVTSTTQLHLTSGACAQTCCLLSYNIHMPCIENLWYIVEKKKSKTPKYSPVSIRLAPLVLLHLQMYTKIIWRHTSVLLFEFVYIYRSMWQHCDFISGFTKYWSNHSSPFRHLWMLSGIGCAWLNCFTGWWAAPWGKGQRKTG